MAKAKTKQAAEPLNEHPKSGFDTLSQDNRDWMKSFEEAGWMFFFTNGEWSALKGPVEDGNESLGPFDSFIVMMNIVEKEDAESNGTQIATEDAKGRPYLPTMGEVIVPELVELGKRRVEIVGRHKAATQELIEVNEDILNAAEKHKDHFVVSEESGSRIYRGAGVEIEIQHVEKEKVKTRLEDPEDE